MKFKNIPYHLFRFLPVLLFLTVFMRFDGIMNPWSISKALYVICAAALLSLVLAAVVMVSRKRVTLKLNALDGFILFFVGYLLVRGVFTAHFSLANPWFILVFVLAGIYFLLKALLRREFNTQRNALIYILIGGFLLAGLIQAVIGLLQLYGMLPAHNRYFKVTGSFGNPNFFAGYLAVIMPVAAGTYLYADKKQIPETFKYLSVITFFACLLALVATHTRAAWLAVAAGVGLVVVCRYHWWAIFAKIANTAVKKAACAVACLCFLAALGAGLYMLKPDSAYGRLFIWKVTATRMVPRHPVFGIGFNRFKAEYDNEQAAYFASGLGSKKEKWVAGNVKKAHNEYLQILAELGIAGLLLFGGLLAGLFWRCNRFVNNKKLKSQEDNRWLMHTMMAALLSAGILAFFSFPFHILPTLVMIIIAGACFSALKPSIIQLPLSLNKGRDRIVLSIFLAIVSAAGFYYSYRTFSHYKQWDKAVRAGFAERTSRADSQFTHLYPALKTNGKFMFTWGSYEARIGRYRKALPLLEQARSNFVGPHLYLLLDKCYQKTEQFNKAEKSLKRAVWMRPQKMYPRYLLVKLYRQGGDQQKAVQEARQLLQMKPKTVTPAGRQIKEKMQTLIKETIHHSNQSDRL
jgi:O-antigen ligase